MQQICCLSSLTTPPSLSNSQHNTILFTMCIKSLFSLSHFVLERERDGVVWVVGYVTCGGGWWWWKHGGQRGKCEL